MKTSTTLASSAAWTEKLSTRPLSKSTGSKSTRQYSSSTSFLITSLLSNSHVQDEHNLWEYLYYIAYIHDKPTTEYTGIESYVSDKLAKRDNSWFPCGQALALKGQTSQAKFSELMNTLQKISEDQEAFLDHAVELKSSINEFKKTKGLENQEFR